MQEKKGKNVSYLRVIETNWNQSEGRCRPRGKLEKYEGRVANINRDGRDKYGGWLR